METKSEIYDLQDESLVRLNKIVDLLEKNIEEVLRNVQILGDKESDCIFNKYIGLLQLSLDYTKSIKSSYDKKNKEKIEIEILKNPGPSIYVKARDSNNSESLYVNELVNKIRNSVNDAELLADIARQVDTIKPDLNSVTNENKEFLSGLIQRAQRANSEKKIIEKPNVISVVANKEFESFSKNNEDLKLRLHDVKITNKLIKDEEVRIDKNIEDTKKQLIELEDFKRKFTNNLKEINPETGKVTVLNCTTSDFLNKRIELSKIKPIDNSTDQEAETKVHKNLGYYELRDRLKREKAKRGLQGHHGSFRRIQDLEAQKKLKDIDDYNKAFKEAIDFFEKEYGQTQGLKTNMRGKRISNGNYLKVSGVSDVEVMAAKLISPKIKLSKVSLDPRFISSPTSDMEKVQEMDDEFNQMIRVEYNVSDSVETPKHSQNNLDNPKKLTVLGRVKNIVSSLVKTIKG